MEKQGDVRNNYFESQKGDELYDTVLIVLKCRMCLLVEEKNSASELFIRLPAGNEIGSHTVRAGFELIVILPLTPW
jgi:hypothetical protein